MKKVDEFFAEETGEEWLRELYKVVAQRRGIMFRLIIESTRLLLFGNAGGAALIIGFMSTAAGNEGGAYHWLALFTVIVFGIGVLVGPLLPTVGLRSPGSDGWPAHEQIFDMAQHLVLPVATLSPLAAPPR